MYAIVIYYQGDVQQKEVGLQALRENEPSSEAFTRWLVKHGKNDDKTQRWRYDYSGKIEVELG